jgi:hypothetical protein
MKSTVMQVNGLKASINMPQRLEIKKDEEGHEVAHDLPPYAVQPVFDVDRFQACPVNWMHGSSNAASYFVKAKEDHGIWLDFNDNWNNEYHVAVLVSVQGANAITAMKATSPALLQIKENCPKHDTPFKSNRWCDKCEYEWPAQNYLCTTGAPINYLWIDGFRIPDGKVEQYVFTEEEMRGIARQIEGIGKDRVFAIGVYFFQSVKKKPVVRDEYSGIRLGQSIVPAGQEWIYKRYKSDGLDRFGESSPIKMSSVFRADPDAILCSSSEVTDSMDEPECLTEELYEDAGSECAFAGAAADAVEPVEPVKNIEIGAGAAINQRVHPDPEQIGFWRQEPSGVLYINYCDPVTFDRIMQAGQKESVARGALQGMTRV